MADRGVHPGVRTITVPWRQAGAGVSAAVALITCGIAVLAPDAPASAPARATASETTAVQISKTSPAIVVPEAALTRLPVSADPFVAGTLQAPALALPDGTKPASSTPVVLDVLGIPARALEAYRRAALLVDTADPGCNIDWALPAAIGRVESNHARFGGNQLDSGGVAQPGIIGIRLDGTNGTARIADTDSGRLDRDSSYDRAVGPMQFIPSTWSVVGSDASGDGVKNPQDLADAATATAVYLCSGPGDLRRPGDLRSAILRYNPSDSYAQTVTAIANAYRHGVRELPASDLRAAHSAPSKPAATSTSANTTRAASNKPVPHSTSPARRRAVAHAAASAPAAKAPASPQPPKRPVPALPIAVPAPTPTGLPSPSKTQQICTITVLGVRTCAIPPPLS